jgi:general nucleoside transport system permease protein
MTEAALERTPTPTRAAPPPPFAAKLGRALEILIRAVGPVILALVACGILLAAMGRNPFTFYANIWKGGVELTAWQDSAMRMAPLLLIAAGLCIVFRANIWNLGIDGQFLMSAAIVSGLAPPLEKHASNTMMLVVVFLAGAAVGAAWALPPALLKARYGTNEIITTLMMTFIGINLANILIKGPFQDFSTNVPQTSVLDFGAMLPSIPGTRIHVGLLVALFATVVVWFVMGRTPFGLRLHVLGGNARAARHIGLSVERLTVTAFLASGALIGLAAAADILGVWGYVRADWNPAFGLQVVPLVFLARLNALACIPFVAFYSVLSIGGNLATREAQLPNDFVYVIVGLILLFMSLTEYFGRKRDLGGVSLTGNLARALRRRREVD